MSDIAEHDPEQESVHGIEGATVNLVVVRKAVAIVQQLGRHLNVFVSIHVGGASSVSAIVNEIRVADRAAPPVWWTDGMCL
jgi:hypothetical protein